MATPLPVLLDDVDFAVFRLEIEPDIPVVVDGTEHGVQTRPAVGDGLRLARDAGVTPAAP